MKTKNKTALSFVSLFLCVFTLGGVLLLASFSAPTAYASKRELPIYSVETDKKVVALTFDCAWGTDYTDELLLVLKDNGVLSTFFAVEFWVNKNKDYVKKIVDGGHAFGTHSSTHSYMSKLSEENIKKELVSSVKAIETVTGGRVTLFRAPYGDYNDLLISTAKKLNLFTIQWDVDSLDWKNLSAENIKKRVVSKVKNGSIVLFHNNGLHTAESLPEIIEALKEKGYSFLRVDEMIYKENYFLDVNGRQKPLIGG